LPLSLVLALVSFLLSAPPPAASDAGPAYVLVVSSAHPSGAVKRRELARIFLKKSTRWEDGTAALPVDQSAAAVVRSSFTHDVMRTEGLGQLSSVVGYWQQQLFSGAGAPPPIKGSDAEVVAFVAANKGAVGYVTTAAELTGVRILKISE
jgi:ABC-type phosphate transport system substrate-binding protein